MQIIKLNIEDEFFNQFMEMIKKLPNGSIEVAEIMESSNSVDPFFDKRKKMIQQRLTDIDSGKLKTHSFEQFESEMDKFEKDLEMKYGN